MRPPSPTKTQVEQLSLELDAMKVELQKKDAAMLQLGQDADNRLAKVLQDSEN